MKTKELANNIYKDLCAELGQLSIQKQSIDDRIKEIINQITLLNALSPKIQEIESNLLNVIERDYK